ncbi:MAG: methyltransferase domain-containing protein [Leptospiraceae bacterium]|nr:methyltransferase domain-containing protein [Leptospiraceae bacterium]MBP9889155.1 methyltransferase domain-containing protein [Leptospiraceae bacterium]
MKCRHCNSSLEHVFADLGTSPPSNSYLREDQLNKPELFYPLRVKVCESCWLVQAEDFTNREEFFSNDYAYFSSFSTTWLVHAKEYVEKMAERFALGKESFVVEVASNDGYLLQYVKNLSIPCLGIEPTKSTADAATIKGIPTLQDFFGVKLAESLARENKKADLTTANNVLAHVPDINDFISGFSILLKDNGVSTFEFPHLLQLAAHTQFDTIYHEHYSYLSLIAVQKIFLNNGLEVFDVEEIPTHGGSLRVFAQKTNVGKHSISDRVKSLLNEERRIGINTLSFYNGFQKKINAAKNQMLEFLIQANRNNSVVIGYGAAAKGNTFINYAGIRSDLVSFVVDKNPHKQGKFLPGSRIPIYSEQMIKDKKPNFVVIFPWNLKGEISNQLAYIREWGGKFVVAIPELEVF